MLFVGMVILVGMSVIGIYIWNERVKRAQVSDALPYVRRRYLCNRDERTFFRYLVKAVAREYLILTKVRLADLIAVDNSVSAKKRLESFEQIALRKVDFVLVDRATTEIRMVIDLFNDSVNSTKRVQQAIFEDKLFHAARIPLLRFRLSENYSITDLKKAIAGAEQQTIGFDSASTYSAPGGRQAAALAQQGRELGRLTETAGGRRSRRLASDADNGRLLGAESKGLAVPDNSADIPSRIKVA